VSPIARYRTKDEIDLRWNRIRRRITRELDLQIADFREEALNDLLSDAFTQYAKSLQTGEVLELETRYASFVSDVLADVITVKVDEAA
jgi:hypothetical protein